MIWQAGLGRDAMGRDPVWKDVISHGTRYLGHTRYRELTACDLLRFGEVRLGRIRFDTMRWERMRYDLIA